MPDFFFYVTLHKLGAKKGLLIGPILMRARKKEEQTSIDLEMVVMESGNGRKGVGREKPLFAGNR